MNNAKEEYIRYTKKFIERLCKGDTNLLEKHREQMQWLLPLQNGFVRADNAQLKEALGCLSEGVKDVMHQDYYAALLPGGHAIVFGTFLTHIKKAGRLDQEQCYCICVVFISGGIACLKIEPKKYIGKRLELRNLERESRFIWEDEIIYIEVMQNHLYWNCRLDVLQTTGTLMELEKELSDFFVRIHRSCLINKNHVSSIRKYEVKMDNGEILQISQKKYLEVKRKLQASSLDK